MARLWRESLSTEDSGGEHCDMKLAADHECEVEEVDEPAAVRFGG